MTYQVRDLVSGDFFVPSLGWSLSSPTGQGSVTRMNFLSRTGVLGYSPTRVPSHTTNRTRFFSPSLFLHYSTSARDKYLTSNSEGKQKYDIEVVKWKNFFVSFFDSLDRFYRASAANVDFSTQWRCFRRACNMYTCMKESRRGDEPSVTDEIFYSKKS